MKETVLVIGGPESMKTGSLIQVAVDNPKMPCWIFDTELDVERTARFFGGMPPNLAVVKDKAGRTATDIQGMMWGMREQVWPALVGKPEGYGAVLINMVRNIEDRAMEAIAEAKYPGGLPEAIEAAVGKNDLSVNPDFTSGEWTNRNAMVNSIVVKALHRTLAHVFITTASKRIVSIKGEKAKFFETPERLTDIWGEYGAVPDGNKDLSFNVGTCIGLDASGLVLRRLMVSMVKDRTRVDLKHSPKFVREELKPDEVRFAGTADQTNVFNVWKFLATRVPGWTWPLPEVAA